MEEPVKINNRKMLNMSMDSDFKFKKHLYQDRDQGYNPQLEVNMHNEFKRPFQTD